MSSPNKLKVVSVRYVLFLSSVLLVSIFATLFLYKLTLSLGEEKLDYVNLNSNRVFNTQDQKNKRKRMIFVVTPVLNAKASYSIWSNLAQYLGKKLGVDIDIAQRRTYKEVNDMLIKGEAEMGLLCSRQYVNLRTRGIVQLLVVPQVRGSVFYHSYIISLKKNSFRSMEDLKGFSFAYSDPLSHSGCLYPKYLLRQKKQDPDHFFSSTLYTYSYDRTLLSIEKGIVKAGAVDSIVFENMVSQKPQLAKVLQILHKSPPFGINPIVVHTKVSLAMRKKLESILLSMHETKEGKAILKQMKVDRFQLGQPKNYRLIEKMIGLVEKK